MTLLKPIKTLVRESVAQPSRWFAARWPNDLFLAAMRRTSIVQMEIPEIRAVLNAVRQPEPCRFVVFGLGNDSAFWSAANQAGATTFIEDHVDWYNVIRNKYPKLDIKLVQYKFRRYQWRDLLDSPEQLQMDLNLKPDGRLVILVDAPAGYDDSTPGRMQSIFTASCLAQRTAESGHRCDVFVHDCNREVEEAYCDRWLSSGRFIQQVGTLRHYRFDSARGAT